MALDIISADEPVVITRTSVMVFGNPGVGKTSTAFTAESPHLLDFRGTGGAHRSEFRKSYTYVAKWDQIDAIEEKDLVGFRTLVIDTVGSMQDVAKTDISKDPSMLKANGELAFAGWTDLQKKFRKLSGLAESCGLDIIYLAHAKEVTDDGGRVVSYRPDISGGTRELIYQDCDSIARIYREGSRRILDWGDADSYCKAPPGFDRDEIPNFHEVPDFMAQKIAGIKKSLGNISEEGKRIAEVVAAWSMELEQVNSAGDINGLVARAGTLDDTEACRKQIKAMIARRAKDLGLKWSKEAGGYVD